MQEGRGRGREKKGGTAAAPFNFQAARNQPPSKRDQLDFFRSLKCTGALLHPVACGTNQGN